MSDMITVLSAFAIVLLVGILVISARTSTELHVGVVGEGLFIRIGGVDALFAFSRGMTVPLSLIDGVAVVPRRALPETGMRLPGTGLPGVLRAGSYGTGQKRDFWLVRRAVDVLVVELKPGQRYRRVVLEVADPRTVALAIRPRTGTYTGSFDT